MNDYRKALTLSIIVLGVITLSGTPEEDISYQTLSDIPYRDWNDSSTTEYMKERCRLDLYYPENSDNFATVVWFHGGGLSHGEKYIPDELKEQGLAVIGVNYRKSPAVKCPAYIEDAAASVAWAFKKIEEYGGDPKLIFVSGASAGGYLTSMVGLDKRWLAKHEVDANEIAGLIPFSGHTITHFTVRAEQGIDGKKPIIDEYAPLFHVRADAPPLILITGDRELEMLGRYEETAYLMRMMKVNGHQQTLLYELDGHDHGAMGHPAFHILKNHVRKISEKIAKKKSKS